MCCRARDGSNHEQASKKGRYIRLIHALAACVLVTGFGLGTQAIAAEICKGYGPQTPRDISSKAGSNPRTFTMAPSSENMNLCNLHIHTNAEHKGPGFPGFPNKVPVEARRASAGAAMGAVVGVPAGARASLDPVSRLKG